ncbi:MAG: S-layer homology domain-containing protein [Microthrixaceae bacterium]
MDVGAFFSCATLSNGAVKCWGAGESGQLGNGANVTSLTPASVVSVTNAVGVSAGSEHACATLSTGGQRCWGRNYCGTLGNGSSGTFTDSNVPVAVSGMTSGASVSAGRLHTCATRTTNLAACWGINSLGALGTGTTANSTTPATVVAGVCQAPPAIAFTDVPPGSTYEYSVSYLLGMGITAGTTPTTFSPGLPISRGQMAMFLWRAAGQPQGSPAHGFSDVPSGAYYSDAVSWLVSAGITSGTSPGHYSPDATVTRAHMAAFLWRATSSPPAAAQHSFNDVPAGAYYSSAVSWLAEAGITYGTSPGVYSPDSSVTRSQMALFLQRRGCSVAP